MCAGSWGHSTQGEDRPYAQSISRAAGERSQRMWDATWMWDICFPTAGRTFLGATGHGISKGSIRSPSISMELGNLKNNMRWYLTACALDPSKNWEASEGQGPLNEAGVAGITAAGTHSLGICGTHGAQTWKSVEPQAQGPHPSFHVHWLMWSLYTCTWVCCAANTPLAFCPHLRESFPRESSVIPQSSWALKEGVHSVLYPIPPQSPQNPPLSAIPMGIFSLRPLAHHTNQCLSFLVLMRIGLLLVLLPERLLVTAPVCTS